MFFYQDIRDFSKYLLLDSIAKQLVELKGLFKLATLV